MVQTVSKWFVRIVIVSSALLCLCFMPISFFVGVMSVGNSSSVPFLSIVIIFIPALVAGLLGIALFWLEYHRQYFPHGALAVAIAAALFAIWLPRGIFFGVVDYFSPPTPEQARTLKWARRYQPAGPAVVAFTVDAVRYRVPHAYLLGMDSWKGGPQYAVSLIVHVPDMKPLPQSADNCAMDRGITNSSNPCGIFRFMMGSGPSRAPEDIFAAAHLQNQKPIEGPFGFEEYDVRENTAFLRKTVDGQTYIYSCVSAGAGAGKVEQCSSLGESAAPSGGMLSFSFDRSLLGNIVQIDAALHQLVNSFVVK